MPSPESRESVTIDSWPPQKGHFITLAAPSSRALPGSSSQSASSDAAHQQRDTAPGQHQSKKEGILIQALSYHTSHEAGDVAAKARKKRPALSGQVQSARQSAEGRYLSVVEGVGDATERGLSRSRRWNRLQPGLGTRNFSGAHRR